ncbi:hypothetical protein QZH41_001717 [Actinostola sp. cb2023]|nr:hypothetical protein QZH41_001717 [Actinostola sp. cb2023]
MLSFALGRLESISSAAAEIEKVKTALHQELLITDLHKNVDKQSYVYDVNLCTMATSTNSHLYTTATSTQRPSLHNAHLYTTATSTQRPPLHNGHLYTTATST